METLLQIIELTEKNKIAKICDDHVKEAGFARHGMPFFAPDPMHEYLCSRGEEPAFPPMEDLPRNEHVSFDVHYFVPYKSRTVHRISITRAHNHEASFIRACFVDGDLIYMSGAGRGKVKRNTLSKLRFNDQERKSGAIQGNLPRFWFHLENQRIDVIADAYYSFEKKLWQGITTRSPSHYGIFVNDQSTVNKNSTLEQYNLQHVHYWSTILSFLFFLPVWLVWMFLDDMFVLPVQQCLTHCEVRNYWIREKNGWMAQSEIGAQLESTNEYTRLLG